MCQIDCEVISMNIGENIKHFRKLKKMTQKQLGELCGIAEPNIRKYELDKQNPKRETIEKIAEALEINPTILLGWENDYNPNSKLAIESSLIEEIQRQYGKDAVQLIQNFTALNAVGKAKALETISDLSSISKYILSSN